LFESTATTDINRYLASQGQQFSNPDLQLSEHADLSDYAFNSADQHMYAKYQAAKKNDSHDAWPLLSLNVQDGNMFIKMGSRYRK